MRNNNPGNLRQWGSRPERDGFAVFDSMEDGLTASVKNLMTQQRRHGLDTIQGIISKWAPSKENNTSAYISDMVKKTGFRADQHLNLEDPKVVAPLISGIVKHEGNGAGVTEEMISRVVAAQTGRGAPASNGAPAPQQMNLVLTVTGLPSGASATAKTREGATVPVRVGYTMPTGVTP